MKSRGHQRKNLFGLKDESLLPILPLRCLVSSTILTRLKLKESEVELGSFLVGKLMEEWMAEEFVSAGKKSETIGDEIKKMLVGKLIGE